jgi:Transposase DDE domain
MARSSVPIIMRLAPGTNRRKISRPRCWPRPCWRSRCGRVGTQGAASNYKKSAEPAEHTGQTWHAGSTAAADSAQTANRAQTGDLAVGTCPGRPVVADREGLGRSRGGLTTKIHLAADTRCRPVGRVTSAGQRHDSVAFTALLADIRITRRRGGPARTRPDRILADKAYSTAKIRGYLRSRGIKATIPQPVNQINARTAKGSAGGRPPAFDTTLYRQRNTVERAINLLRGHRAVANRYDKREFVYKGTIDVATIRIWLRHPTQQDPQDTA